MIERKDEQIIKWNQVWQQTNLFVDKIKVPWLTVHATQIQIQIDSRLA